ncbi:hypothetical protein AABB24_002830 [Solanum stoloniferum]|uniref:Stigma-specific Stig1 family protein n=3 Tax=Solanum TaxID=4107 RepID=A0A9J6A8T2_SOLCO|nr:hypothetical protein H5410_005910 [Solanum commersonii]WMV14439.1 hypothetical protein MTR67_007824 [Solanum verrucosum]
MNSFKFLFVILLSISIIIALFPSLSSQELHLEGLDASYSRGKTSFLSPKQRYVATCDKYPRVCAAKGSRGPDCCKKQCVNVFNDRSNCGKCGNKCKYSEICCQGWCVNIYVNKKHCGKCNNVCKKGSSCSYGMCNYA